MDLYFEFKYVYAYIHACVYILNFCKKRHDVEIDARGRIYTAKCILVCLKGCFFFFFPLYKSN